ncbi:cyclophilin-like fold protein [Desulfofustis glycolicus]|uniref:Cyclophilin TM1367-like domain-containing protein n=1 Tax=Desulfofustis glycolicus DSM 9705 TaxID=1121409 RepID=A0A1M5X4V7_9BACT|nr:cyclophilin-like fold protein [Desulfofustis glycolicus]MCB2216094.1 hypothetical protein [Desulfobulbaceae bacterium]SHH94837.1 hypothetical protein SAMN02745124_02753 [Desulfofustis glycolicus DSM 9705]
MPQITISWPAGTITAVLRDTPTARRLLDSLPISGRANVWGDEVYFSVPFSADPEPDAATVVDKGAVCFWLDGDALALLFGPTPVSQGDECRLISAANIVGMIDGDPSVLRTVRSGDVITVDIV